MQAYRIFYCCVAARLTLSSILYTLCPLLYALLCARTYPSAEEIKKAQRSAMQRDAARCSFTGLEDDNGWNWNWNWNLNELGSINRRRGWNHQICFLFSFFFSIKGIDVCSLTLSLYS